jgi:hypothetical protein
MICITCVPFRMCVYMYQIVIGLIAIVRDYFSFLFITLPCLQKSRTIFCLSGVYVTLVPCLLRARRDACSYVMLSIVFSPISARGYYLGYSSVCPGYLTQGYYVLLLMTRHVGFGYWIGLITLACQEIVKDYRILYCSSPSEPYSLQWCRNPSNFKLVHYAC